jgi:hypothetical protein
MTNVACLYPRHFAKIVAGRKQTERRLRKRIDSRLESIQAGERILFLECRTQRAIEASAVRVSTGMGETI